MTAPVHEPPGREPLPTADPQVTEETAPFWEALAQGRLLLPRCTACDTVVWYPRPHCPRCQHDRLDWVELSGRGRVHSYTVVRRARGEWADHAPYVVAYVELDEGPRLLTNVVTDDLDGLHVDQPVELAVDRSPGGGALHRFRPIG